MKNITLSADEDLIERARQVARARNTTLTTAFREWLADYAAQSGGTRELDSLMKRLRHVRARGHFTREELNER